MRYLIVEGITDVALIKYICVQKGITIKFNDFKSEAYQSSEVETYRFNDLYIINIKGQDKLLYTLENLIKPNEIKIEKLAIIQDADSDFEASKEKINQAIKKAKITKEVEIFLTPNNQDLGDLETLLLSTLESNSILECFDEYAECLKAEQEVYPKALNKGKVHAYTMYSQKGENLYKPMQSFMHKKNKKYQDTNLWDIDHPNFKPIVDFVLQIFGEKA